jgi:hypothetical protein
MKWRFPSDAGQVEGQRNLGAILDLWRNLLVQEKDHRIAGDDKPIEVVKSRR